MQKFDLDNEGKGDKGEKLDLRHSTGKSHMDSEGQGDIGKI